MCLVLLAIRSHPGYKLVFGANRDEYYDRPTSQAAFWEEYPQMLAGKDLRGGGTWMGITRQGRIAAITNYRDPANHKDLAPSRGKLVTKFLTGEESPDDYLNKLGQESRKYNGFNLLVGVRERLWWYSNRGDETAELGPGIYGLSNRLLDTPWPKVKKGKKALSELISRKGPVDPEEIFKLLRDPLPARDKELPDTGVGLPWERILSPLYISSATYGTRSSTVLLIDQRNDVTFVERTFDMPSGNATDVSFELRV